MSHRWHITLFGELTAQRGAEQVAQFDTRQTAGLLAYLALYRHRAHSRELLADRLWPEEDSSATRSRLRTTLWALRRILEPNDVTPGSVLIADRAEVHLAPESVTTDVEQFERAVSEAVKASEPMDRVDRLCRAADLYTAELLAGWYDDWVLTERNRLAETYRTTLQNAAATLAELGDLDRATVYAKRSVAADVYQEEAHAALIQLYIQAGRPVDAVRQYRELERRLAEMGLRPSPPTRALLSRAHGSTAPLPSSAAPSLPARLESPGLHPGGAMLLSSTYYIQREVDEKFTSAVARQDSIVLVKGARQVGKTSLLARSLQQAREAGIRVVLTDFQKLTSEQLQTSDQLFLTLARDIAEQLDLDLAMDEIWLPSWGWNVNFERFLRREVLKAESAPLVWALDEVDRLFGRADSADIFGLFRSWHNARALNPDGPWSRLTLAIAYATEAYLFITDLNQSPFNVGTRLTLGDFTPEEVTELNRRYRSPLHDETELTRYIALVGGHPYLVQRGLHALAMDGLDLSTFIAQAARDDGLFGDHLRRMRQSLGRDVDLCSTVRTVMRGEPCSTSEAFFRLQSAGVLTGGSNLEARLRCGLYRTYLEQHLS